MAFDGTEGGAISLELAAAMTAAYRNQNQGATKGHFFGKDILNEILAQDGCVGVRMYYGIDSTGGKQLILVGVDVDENDMTELVADLSFPCPNRCSSSNELNSSR